MKLRGEVFSGSTRGTQLIEKHFARLIGLVGFRPYPGTLNIRLDRNFDIIPYATKRIDHVLRHGAVNTDAYLVPVTVRKVLKSYTAMGLRDKEDELVKDVNELINLTTKEEFTPGYECWAIHFTGNLGTVVELIAKESLRKTLGLEDGDKVEIQIVDQNAKHPENKLRRGH
jgi:CTP-dependent riboflavin kinase